MKLKKICALICAALLINATAFSAKNDKFDPALKSGSAFSSQKTEKNKTDPAEKNAPDEVKANEINYDMDTEKVEAKGKVNVRHKEEPAKNSKNKNKKSVPSELNADNVDYDMKTGVVTATGNVLLKHGTGRATGERAMYNVNTQEAYLTGNVIVIRDDMKITCQSLTNDGYGHMQATGNVNATQTIKPNKQYPKGDVRTFKGEHVDYYPDDKKHIVIPTGGILTSKVEGKFIANYMEGWIDDEYYFGTGDVHLVNPPKELEGGGDRVDYYARENGKAVLTGNAWVIQKNNTMRGNRLTVYLADEQTPQPANTKKNVLPHETLDDTPFKNE